MTSDRLSCEVSKIDQAMLGPSTRENAIPIRCANILKPEDQLKVTNARPLSHTPVTSNPAPFKCPFQHFSRENIPSGKFSCVFLASLRSLLFLFFVAVKIEALDTLNVCHFFSNF